MLQTDEPMQRSASAGDESHSNMVLVSGGTFRMGSDKHYPEEAPVHRVTVDAFRIDKTPVTNRQFKEFVRATGHITVAELVPDPKDYPGALPHMIYAGSMVFSPPKHPVDLRNWSQWWTFLRGANWRRPYGPKSNINVLGNHPVVHVAYADALAYARLGWTRICRRRRNGSSLPAVGWNKPNSPGEMNSCPVATIAPIPGRGEFPHQNLCNDGFARTSPVNDVSSERLWRIRYDRQRLGMDQRFLCARAPSGCIESVLHSRKIREARANRTATILCQPQIKIPRKVLKGGSHLCAPNYCRRYRPAARHAEPVDTSTSHVGFRCVARER